jgi:hypothetical protein
MHQWITTEARAISAMTGIPLAEVIDGCDRSVRTGTAWTIRGRSAGAPQPNNANATLRTVHRDESGRITEVEEHLV